MTEPITEAELRARLRAACDAAGGQKAYADSIGVSEALVSLVLLGKQSAGPAISRPLGFTKHIERRYIPITKSEVLG